MSKRKDSVYVSGVIAVKEKKLLKDKLAKMCSMSREEALRLLLDSGFGGEVAQDVEAKILFDTLSESGSGGNSFPDIEPMILADEREIDAFIREYAPTDEAEEYLLSSRDFHNAKAIVKARYLRTDPGPMLGGNGRFDFEEMIRLVETGKTEKLGKELSEAIKEAEKLLEGENPSGAEIGFLFDRAQFAYLSRVLKKLGTCRKLLIRRADMTNLLTYFRAENADEAAKFFLEGGTLTKEKLACIYGGEDAALKAFEKSDYEEFVKKLCSSSGGGFTEAEKMLESFETDFFSEKPYELSGQGNFLYYIFRRRAENENVRIVFGCLGAGLSETEIKRRLRGKV